MVKATVMANIPNTHATTKERDEKKRKKGENLIVSDDLHNDRRKGNDCVKTILLNYRQGR